MMKFKLAVLTFILLAVPLTPSHSIINGTAVVGSDFVVTMLFGDEKPTSHCTGAYLRPRVVVTAAHCVIAQGARAPQLTRPIDDWYVSQPGVDWQSAETKSSRVKVLKIWTDPDYFNRWEPDKGLRETQVNDVAFLFLERELNGPTVSRAANREEIESFRAGQGRAFHLGYGCIGASYEQRRGNDGKPYLSEGLVGTRFGSLATPIWDRFLLAQYQAGKGEVCSGDSGSPLLMKKENEILYLGTIFAGGNGAAGQRYAATTVLWPFVPALDEAYEQFLIEDAKNRELKAKQEAEAKAAAEAKAKQEAEAKAEAEARAKAVENGSFYREQTGCHARGVNAELQIFENGIWRSFAAAQGWDEACALESNPVQPWVIAEVPPGSLLRWRIWAPGSWDVSTEPFQETTSRFRELAAEAKAEAKAVKKETTITCVKGKKVKKVKAVKPKCPKGYKKK